MTGAPSQEDEHVGVRSCLDLSESFNEPLSEENQIRHIRTPS